MRIKKILEHYLQDNVSPQECTMLRSSLAELFEASDRYQNGLKGHEMVTIASLLELYERTEKLFGGSIEARVLALQEQNKDDLEKVASLVLSHIKAQSKAKLVLALRNYVKTSGINVSNTENRIYKSIQGLASLEAK
jgi:acetyl-CoA carboxylase/biotin carboxylase 1